ncbi:MAG: cellulase family glycosylhydrolase [Eubacteriales bacterium]|nr:cellulase family glycosylhydrolase [Eubacteriales bacterium]
MQKITSFIMATIILISIVSLGTFSVSAEYATEAYSKTYYRGVNLSGAESAGHILPGVEGTDYTFGEEKIFAYLERKGFDIARVPVLWERLQHTLSGPLDTAYVNGLKRNAQWAANHNMKIVIDVHNYGKYNGEFIGIEGSDVRIEDYADLWTKLSTEFKDNTGVYAYDIMNEPIFDDYKDWHKASQAAVSAIRANGDDTLIYVEGNFWGHCEHWTDINGEEPWINDSMDNTSYSAHCYFDTDTSGSYKLSFDEQLKETPDLLEIGTNRVREFGKWCKKYNLKGYIGEYGVPYRDDSKTGEYENYTRWSKVMDNFLDTLDYYKMDATAWAAGHWWDKINILNIYPANPNMNPLVDDSVHMDTFTNHLSNKEDSSPLLFGDNRVFESEYSVIAGTGSRVNNSSLSNGQHVSLSANSSLDFCRIKSSNGRDTLIKISYMARNGGDTTISVDNKIVKEVSFESVGKYTDYETIITLPTGKSSIQINTTSQSGAIFIDKITLISLKTNQLAFISPIDGDYIKLHYAADKPYNDVDIYVNGEVKRTANIPSTYGKQSTLTIPLDIKATDKVEIFKGYPSVNRSSKNGQ